MKAVDCFGKVSGLLILVFLVSCTSSEFGDQVLQGAKQKLEKEYRSEGTESLGRREKFLSKYVEACLQLTKLEPGAEHIDGSRAQVEVRAHRPPAAARAALREVMAKIEDWKDTSFNAPDALQMVTKKMNLEPASSDVEVLTVKFVKNSGWNISE